MAGPHDLGPGRLDRVERFSPHPCDGVLDAARCTGRRCDRSHLQQPRRLRAMGLLLGQARFYGAAGRSAHARATRRQQRAGRRVQRVLEGLPHRPRAVQEAGHAGPCGDLRARFYRGAALLDTGALGVGALFTGDDPTTVESLFGTSTLTAAQYNALWTSWGGFLLRPDNFDDLVAERYGSVFGPGRNPVPEALRGSEPDQRRHRPPARDVHADAQRRTARGAGGSASRATPATAAPRTARSRPAAAAACRICTSCCATRSRSATCRRSPRSPT